jgi:hypothetical protein
MLVSISSLQTFAGDDLQEGIYAQTRVGIYFCAFSIDKGAREIDGIDSTREEQGVVKVEVLGICDYS